jgi:hypothetical protein
MHQPDVDAALAQWGELRVGRAFLQLDANVWTLRAECPQRAGQYPKERCRGERDPQLGLLASRPHGG